jgi:hypothetical protein
MTDKEWLKRELKRTSMSRGSLARESQVYYSTIQRVLTGEKLELTAECRAKIKRVFDRTPTAPHRDYDGLREVLRATGLTASMIRTHAGVANGAVARYLDGKIPTPSVYDRLDAWVKAGMPVAPRTIKTPKTGIKSPSLRGNIARTLDIIEGRAGVAPESSMGEGYLISSVMPTIAHYDMPARNRANKYVQY